MVLNSAVLYDYSVYDFDVYYILYACNGMHTIAHMNGSSNEKKRVPPAIAMRYKGEGA